MNEQFALFLFDECQPCGGVNDLDMIGSLADCVSRAESTDHDTAAQVVEMQTLTVVQYGGWTYTPLDRMTGLTADRGKIVWRYEWAKST
jgi:hypothetical protein